ncbi:Ig-like domain-containing protein [bacterium]|nr:Ig-like domain-containing protein [bacterium]
MTPMMTWSAKRTPAALLFCLILAFGLATAGCSCSDDGGGGDDQDTGGLPVLDDDDDADDDDTADDDVADDDDADDDDVADDDDADDDDADDDDAVDDDADDDTEVTLESIEIVPASGAVPEGVTKGFTAIAHYSDDSTSDAEDFVWASDDTDTFTVDDEGNVTGVANGQAALSASLGDMTGEADVLVGPDVFFYDGVAATLAAYDRGTDTVDMDYLAAKAAVAAVPLGLALWEGNALIVEGGDFGPGQTGDEGVVAIDLFTGAVGAIDLPDADNPNFIAVSGDTAYVPSSLTNELFAIDLVTGTIDDWALANDCAPGDVLVHDGRVFVACTGFDSINFTYADPGRIAIVDLSDDSVSYVNLSQVNPGALAANPDGTSLYVACTGDYFSEFGAVDEIDLATDAVVDTVDLTGTALTSLAMTPAGLAFLGDSFAGNVYVLDTSDNSLTKDTGDPIVVADAFWIAEVAYNPFGNTVYVADWTNQQIAVFDAATFAEGTALAATNPSGFAFWNW